MRVNLNYFSMSSEESQSIDVRGDQQESANKSEEDFQSYDEKHPWQSYVFNPWSSTSESIEVGGNQQESTNKSEEDSQSYDEGSQSYEENEEDSQFY